MNVAFLGRGSITAARHLAEMLNRAGVNGSVVITAAAGADGADVLVMLSPVASKRKISCHILVAPCGADDGNVRCDRKLCCGMGEENEITASSVGEKTCIASLGREVKTLSGKIIERCEMRVEKVKGLSPEALLAVIGCALMLDAPSDKII